MKNLLLIALVALLCAVWASQPGTVCGFYLNQEPITIEKACAIMLNPENFKELPGLSIVTPLSVDDTALLVQTVASHSVAIMEPDNGLWQAWLNALELPEEHPTAKQCSALYPYLVGALHLGQMPHILGAELVSCTLGSNRKKVQMILRKAVQPSPEEVERINILKLLEALEQLRQAFNAAQPQMDK